YPEAGQGIALDSAANVYITGVTSSINFPMLQALQSTLRGSTDAFVTKLTPAGALSYSTYLGGTGLESGNGIAVDSSGSAYVVGYTFSSDLAVIGATQSA